MQGRGLVLGWKGRGRREFEAQGREGEEESLRRREEAWCWDGREKVWKKLRAWMQGREGTDVQEETSRGGGRV